MMPLRLTFLVLVFLAALQIGCGDATETRVQATTVDAAEVIELETEAEQMDSLSTEIEQSTVELNRLLNAL